MGLTSLLRRTNKIELDPPNGLLFKIYRSYPYTVIPQVILGLRSGRSLDAAYRCRTELRKVTFLKQVGFPLAQHYLDFIIKSYEPTTTMRYAPTFLNLEEKICQGVSTEEAFMLVGKGAARLLELHQAGKMNGEVKITHGDPYLENIRVMEDGSVRWFDFEHEYNLAGDDAVAMDGAIFVGHAFQVLRDGGHIKSKQDRTDLRDAIEQHYPGLRTDAPQGRMYLRVRFGGTIRFVSDFLILEQKYHHNWRLTAILLR